jgi:hypothetical protein
MTDVEINRLILEREEKEKRIRELEDLLQIEEDEHKEWTIKCEQQQTILDNLMGVKKTDKVTNRASVKVMEPVNAGQQDGVGNIKARFENRLSMQIKK